MAGPDSPRCVNSMASRKLCAVARDDCFQRDAGENLVDAQHLRGGLQRHQRGQPLGDPQAEALREVIGKAGRAHFRNREPAGRQHQRRRRERAVGRRHAKAIGAGNIGDGVAGPDIDVPARAFGEQHGDDGAGRVVAEQLSEGLFVIGDAMAFDQGDEISLGVAVQARICRNCGFPDRKRSAPIWRLVKLQRPPPEIRIFSPTSLGMIEQQDLLAALARGQGAHQSGRASPDNDGVERRRCCRHSPLVPAPPPV